MKITYSIQVCNESRELYSLINFLLKVIDEEDNIQVIVDSLHKTDKVDKVIEHFKEKINVFERPFDTFYKNSCYHGEVAMGEYTFLIDADEMPQEKLITNLKNIITETEAEIFFIPRINIHPGMTQSHIDRYKFNVNEAGWINWPDYQGRLYKNCESVTWTDELHTKLTGSTKIQGIVAKPELALWHIKSMEKQESRWNNDGEDFTICAPSKENLYDMLM
tara:strand:+ start:144 stop:803 length:660 start_codon:yes stop_codon:yes gene_type:complete